MELKDDVFYTPTEFAKLRNCSVPTALSIYNLQDFPSENFGKEKVALGSAIREWYSKSYIHLMMILKFHFFLTIQQVLYFLFSLLLLIYLKKNSS